MDKTPRRVIQSNPTVLFRHHFQVTIFYKAISNRNDLKSSELTARAALRGANSGGSTRVQRSAPLQSTGQRWRLVNEACIVDLLDKKVRDVGARDEARAPVACIHKHAYAPVRRPSVRIVGRTIVQSSRLRRMIHSCASLSA